MQEGTCTQPDLQKIALTLSLLICAESSCSIISVSKGEKWGGTSISTLRFLLDTNVFIPLEPARPNEQELLSPASAKLLRLAMEAGHRLYLHPAAKTDLGRDRDTARRDLRNTQFGKYPELPDPPGIPAQLTAQLGRARTGTNDWVDYQLIGTLMADAVDFLITEDRKLRNKTQRMGLLDRVLSVNEAVTLIQDLSEHPPTPLPAIRAVKAHAIDRDDSIFQSLREDYPDFNIWFSKCRKEHRQAWIIKGNQQRLAGVCIINHEQAPPAGLSGKVLKICSFKVSEQFNGLRFGELLLRAVFEYAFNNEYVWAFITVFERHGKLIDILKEFGFSTLEDKTPRGELILAKPLRPAAERRNPEDALEYHVRYGPPFFKTNVPWYVVPIQPKFSDILFPETAHQRSLFPGCHAFGNSIRKAYLCHSSLRAVPRGAVLVFYRSRRNRGGIIVGVVEDTVVSSSAEAIARKVGKRTVYTMKKIEELCQQPVLAVLFRQARVLDPPIPRQELVKGKVFIQAPQSIVRVKEEGVTWLQSRMGG